MIVGITVNFKFTKSKKYQGGEHNNVVYTAIENAIETINVLGENDSNRSITQDQFNQLFTLLQQVKIE